MTIVVLPPLTIYYLHDPHFDTRGRPIFIFDSLLHACFICQTQTLDMGGYILFRLSEDTVFEKSFHSETKSILLI